MKKEIFKGSAVALVTPFKKNIRKIDYNKLSELIDYHINNKTDAIVIAGTTGESSTLSTEEHKEIIEFAINYANKKIPIIAGTGSNSTEEAVRLSKFASKKGADGLLIVTPYYNKCSQQGLFEHYRLIARKVDSPIILYNVPSRTGVNFAPETVEELSKIPNIVGIKEASGDLTQVKKIINRVDCKEFSVYSGNDDQINDLMELGGKGVISVLANICPQQVHKLCQEALKGNYENSRRLQIQYLQLVKSLLSDINPIPVKEALNILGFNVGGLRMPLTRMSNEAKEELNKTLVKYKKQNLIY